MGWKDRIWLDGSMVPAERTTSVNRPTGTPIWKNETIDRKKYRELLLNKVMPAIQEKWPRGDWMNNKERNEWKEQRERKREKMK